MKNMLNKLVSLTFLTALSFGGMCDDLQQQNKPEQAITTPIHQLFDGMREHDQQKILAQFSQQALLQRITAKGEIIDSDVKKFAESISKSSAKLDEQLLSETVLHQGQLASVWTPFVFYLNDKISHCGTNSFQMVQINGEWKIQYLIDVAYQGDCQTFIKQHN